MSRPDNLSELTTQLEGMLKDGVSLQTLRSEDGSLAPALESLLGGRATDQRGQRLSDEARERWELVAQRAGSVTFRVAPRPAFASALLNGAYDLTAGLRMGPINEVIASLYDTRTWPRQIPASAASQLLTLDALRAFSDDVPDGANLAVGPLRFTAAPTLQPVNGTDNFVVFQPFSLEIDRPAPVVVLGGNPARVVVTTLDGVLRFGARAAAEVSGDELRLVLSGVVATSEANAVRIEVDDTSPIQPDSPEALEELETFVQGRFDLAVITGQISVSYSLCPVINLPLGEGVPLRLQRVDVRTLDADGGLVMIGVLLGPTTEIDEGAGDPERLLTSPFRVDVSNVHLALHEVLVQKIVQQAKASGELERLARQENDDLRIAGATAELRPNEVRIIIDGRLKDACGPPGFTFKDVGFRATRTYRYAVFGGEIVVTEEEDINLDNTDTAVCVLLGALEALIAGALFGVFGALADVIAQVVRYIRLSPGGGSDDPIRLNAVFATNLPVPGTELLPRAETLQSLVEDDQILANGVITLRDDDVNTYIYAAFLERSGTLGTGRTPLANSRVRLFDQDVPPPANDDARIPVSETEVVFSGPKRRVTVTTSFEPPISDQLLATGRTSSEGVVRFVLRPNQIRTTAGTVVTTTVTELLDRRPPVPPEVTTQRTPLREQRPDIYFEVALSNGRVVDTTTLASGLVVNLASRRVGNADSPLTFVVGHAGPVIARP